MGKGKKKQQTSPEASSEDSSIDFLSRPVTGNTPPLTGGITLPMDPRFLKPGGYNYNVNYNMSDGEGGDDDDDEDDDDDDDEEGDEEEGEDDEEEGESEEEQEEDESDSSSPQPEPSYRKKAGDKKGPKTGKSGTKGNRRESSPQPGPSHRQPSPKRKKPVPKKNLHKETSKTPAKVTGKTPAKGTGKTQAKGTGKTPAKDTGKTPAVKKGSKRKQAQPKRHMSRVLEEIRRLQASDNFLIPRAPFHRYIFVNFTATFPIILTVTPKSHVKNRIQCRNASWQPLPLTRFSFLLHKQWYPCRIDRSLAI